MTVEFTKHPKLDQPCHFMGNGYFLRDDKGIRSDEESYSLFTENDPEVGMCRLGIFTGPLPWALEEANKKIKEHENDSR